LIAVALLVIAAIAAFVVIPKLDDDTKPNNTASTSPSSGAAGGEQKITGLVADDFDPYGTSPKVEHPNETGLATDGDSTTGWPTETYTDPIPLGENATKPGVGLIIDLGDERTFTRVEIQWDTPGTTFELRAATERGDSEDDFGFIEEVAGAPAQSEVSAPATSARYLLIWITGLPTDSGGRTQINEVRVFGP
jgi:putative peptidoglycan lipid II flippase